MPMSSSAPFQPLSYEDRLSRNVDQYIKSVIDFPQVRYREFAELHAVAALDEAQQILEVPAEGKMLELFYPNALIERADFLQLHVRNYAEQVMRTNWALHGLAAHRYDALLAVVPFHHANEQEKAQYLAGAWRVLKTGGVLAFGEVEADSRVHQFLDGFVNAHTESGHIGAYPTASLNSVLQAQGFQEVHSANRDCPWRFESETALHSYVCQLFGLRPIGIDVLLKALDELLGLHDENGQIYLNWSLRYFRGVKHATAV